MKYARIALAVVIGVGAMFYANWALGHPLWTFDLYYFSGVVERHGSYTDVPSVVAAADAAHKAIDHQGAYGAPTLLALFFQPISLLPLGLAHIVWQVLVAISMFLSIRKAARDNWPIWLALFAVAPMTLLGLGVGNAVLLTTPLLIYTYAALRDGQDKRAGIALAIAISLKAYPAFLLLVFIFTRRWQALKWCAGGLAVLGVFTFAALGPNGTVDAIRLTLQLGNRVHAGGQNISMAGTVAQYTTSSVVRQSVLWLSELLAVLVVYSIRKLPVHVVLAGACAAMLLSQSMSWREYTALAIVCAFALKDFRVDRVTFGVVALGVFFCIGTSWSPFGLETGVNPLTVYLAAPSASQTLGLLLCTYGFTRMKPTLTKPSDVHTLPV